MPALQAQSSQLISTPSTSVEDGSKQVGFARIDSEKRIWLDPTQPVQSSYQVDMSHLGYNTRTSAENFFTNFSSSTVQFSVVDANTLTFQLSPTSTQQSWTVDDWNQLFETKAAALKASTK
jgi:hypothetical protein